MKKFFVCILLISCIAVLAVCFTGQQGEPIEQTAYLRIHIRANSDSEADQAVKYQVRDAVVAHLTPLTAECGSKAEAVREIEKSLCKIAEVAKSVLLSNGFDYGARALLRREDFPTRVYNGVTLSAGVYDALILELGTGSGDNWWCVVYPPLCFVGGSGNVVYKSKIAEIIRTFFGS